MFDAEPLTVQSLYAGETVLWGDGDEAVTVTVETIDERVFRPREKNTLAGKGVSVSAPPPWESGWCFCCPRLPRPGNQKGGNVF